MIDDDYAVGELFQFRKVVGTEENGLSQGLEREQVLADIPASRGIETGGGLIQHQ